MKNTKYEWEALFEVAQEDKKALNILLQSDVALPISCFHAQQAVEKYIKSVLSKRKIKYPFIHDLIELSAVFEEKLPVTTEDLEKLNPFAVKSRYDLPPEIHATHEEVKEIVELMSNWCKNQIYD